MKKYLVLFVIFLCCTLDAAQPQTNLLSIHLVVPNDPPQLPQRPPTPTDLKIVFLPVLTDVDFVAFNTTNQTFAITPEAAKRLAREIWHNHPHTQGEKGAPYIFPDGTYELISSPALFVFKVSGEPIYVGAFYRMSSSESFAGPAIIPDNSFISTNLTSNVTFSVLGAYPGPHPFPGFADPRRDRRIVSAVQKLFAHEKQ